MDLTFTFVASGTKTPVLLDDVAFTFFDIDQGKKPSKGYEAVAVCHGIRLLSQQILN